MYTFCATEKAAAKQQQFQDALLRAMKYHAYSEITVTQLCKEAGLSRKTFYRLFGCKEDVLCALIDSALLRYDSLRPAESSLEVHMHRMFSYWKEQAPLLDALGRNHQNALLIERGLIHLSGENSNAAHYLNVENIPNQREALLFFLSGVLGLVIYWHHTGFSRSVEEMAAIAGQLLTHPPLSLPNII